MTIKYIGKRENVIKHSHGRCGVGDFRKNLHEGYIWTGPRNVLYFILKFNISSLCTSQ